MKPNQNKTAFTSEKFVDMMKGTENLPFTLNICHSTQADSLLRPQRDSDAYSWLIGDITLIQPVFKSVNLLDCENASICWLEGKDTESKQGVKKFCYCMFKSKRSLLHDWNICIM